MNKKLSIPIFLLLITVLIGYLFIRYKPANYWKCVKSGGEYKPFPVPIGAPPVYNCVYTYSDGGKKCTNNNECQGNCLITDDTILKESKGVGISGPKIIGGFGMCEHTSGNSPCYPGDFENTLRWCI